MELFPLRFRDAERLVMLSAEAARLPVAGIMRQPTQFSRRLASAE